MTLFFPRRICSHNFWELHHDLRSYTKNWILVMQAPRTPVGSEKRPLSRAIVSTKAEGSGDSLRRERY